jgi:hypothetical protein
MLQHIFQRYRRMGGKSNLLVFINFATHRPVIPAISLLDNAALSSIMQTSRMNR